MEVRIEHTKLKLLFSYLLHIDGLKQLFYLAYAFMGQEFMKGSAGWLISYPRAGPSWGQRMYFQGGCLSRVSGT